MTDAVLQNCGCCNQCVMSMCDINCIENEVITENGITSGYNCYVAPKSYFTHESMNGAGYLSNGNCTHEGECASSEYQEIMVTFDTFTIGFQGCRVIGGSFVLINPQYVATSSNRPNRSCWPYLGSPNEGHPLSLTCPHPCPCQLDTTSDINKYIEETGLTCQWEYGGASYNFFDQTDNGIFKRCTTYPSPCSECHTVFFGTTIPSRFGEFTIRFSRGIATPFNVSLDIPVIAITAGNIILPNPTRCGTALAYYYPESYFEDANNNKYINCIGTTTFYKIYQQFGSFPESMTLEIL